MAWKRSGVRIPITPHFSESISNALLKIKRLIFKIKRLAPRRRDYAGRYSQTEAAS